MPTYQYACTECGHRLEAVQSFTDAPLAQCPECTGRLRKLFNSVGIVFKGSGFYRTDSREKVGAGKSGSEGGSSEAKSTPSNGSGSGGDSSNASSTGASSSPGPAAGNGASSSTAPTPTAAASKA